MANCNCYCKTNCAGLSIVASIIIGIITAMLSFIGRITLTPAFLWVLFGISVVYLAISLVVSAFTQTSGINKCTCITVPIFLIGILATILLSIVLLGITVAPTSLTGTILAGLLLASFSLTISSTACLVKCQLNCYND